MQAELIAASAASDMGIWFYNLSCSLPFVFGPSKAIPLLMDNLAALSVANHPKHNPVTRHIYLTEFRIRDAHEFLDRFVPTFVQVPRIVLITLLNC